MLLYVRRRRLLRVHWMITSRHGFEAKARQRRSRSERPGASGPVGDGVGPGWARRTLDIVLSLTAVALLWPLLAVIAVAVRVSSPGRVIFAQPRVGQGGRTFQLYKFRSMRVGADGPGLTLVGDSRVTRLGHLLRATSLDELPQLFNVLRGDMTLVGARPETIDLAARYRADLAIVFRYRPGLTGPAQLRLRDHLESDARDVEARYLAELVPLRVEMDLGYLSCPTLGRTLGLIWETAVYVLFRSAGRLRETRAIAV